MNIRYPIYEGVYRILTLGAKYPTTYLQPLKGWGIWVKNKGRKRIILQDDA
jgi:hypothetical protein